MRALSGLTPGLSRRLQRQLLAHLPPAAARTLRRTLSLRESDPAEPPAAAPPAAAPLAPPCPSEDRPAAPDPAVPQYCTLPRLRRRRSPERSPSAESAAPAPAEARPRDRPLLSKYLTPERALSLDDSYSSEGSLADTGASLRRHSMRLSGEPARRRVSRFLRSDFFDAPADESVYARRRKEKELETQKILREIREKRNRSLEASSVKSPTEIVDPPSFRDETGYTRKCLSPVGLLSGKERSRSTTPFFPILDNIKETVSDTPHAAAERRAAGEIGGARPASRYEEGPLARESKLVRPKSYPVKDLDSVDDSSAGPTEGNKENEYAEKSSQRESRLIRPRSYPTSSPSPEKVYLNRSITRKEEVRGATPKEETPMPEGDIEVSFSITLPRKKSDGLTKADSLKNSESLKQNVDTAIINDRDKTASDNLVVKKYQIINSTESSDKTESKIENGAVVANGGPKDAMEKENFISDDKSNKATVKKEEVKLKSADNSSSEKKGTIKKKIIKKVSSKSKTDLGNSQETGEAKAPTEKKKVTKKVKEKTAEDGTKTTTVTKKKSMLQSIGHKLEKFTTKSTSPEKGSESAGATDKSNDVSKVNRTQREQSVPVTAEPPTESNLIKRAVTLTDVAALETQPTNNTKTTVSKVLGLFKKFEPKEKPPKPLVEKSQSDNLEVNPLINSKPDIVAELVSDSTDKDKPRRPTSLLLNGLGRKNKYGRTASDSVSVASVENDEQPVLKKESEPKNLRNTLKLDFSRLPRVKKIVPTNPVIEPQVMNSSSEDKVVEKSSILEKNGTIADGVTNNDTGGTESRSRSRSRSTISEQKSDLSADRKSVDKQSVSPLDTNVHHPLRNHESTSPEKEDIVDRIRRKSFYTRFNEKKQRRKSSLVGPGAAEYDPLSRIHSPPVETKFDVSPTSPITYDLSPGYSIGSDISPSTDRYRALADLPINSRNNLRYDYGLNDKIDTYRSLDRNDFRKYTGSRSYLDYDQPSSYVANRYSRTKSLLDSSDGTEESCLGQLRDPQKYNRTLSMYSPGNYATYRPKRTLNSAIILKESETEPSPENILDKIRQRKKISISVTRKPDPEKEPLPRSTVPPKGEGDGAECSEKTD